MLSVPMLAVSVTTAANANPGVFTTSLAHGYPTGTIGVVVSGGTGAWTAVNGNWTATRISTTMFSIPVDTTALGSYPEGVWVVATQIVCSSLTTLHDGRACTTTNAATAISAALPGDRVILRAGDTFNVGEIFLPANDGSGMIIVESSRIGELPEDYRVHPTDVPKLATLALSSGTSILGAPRQTVVVFNPATDIVTSTGNHGLVEGDKVALQVFNRSPILCYDTSLPLYTSADPYNNPCLNNADYIYERFGGLGTIVDGMPIRVYARTLPPELTQGGLYYIRDRETYGTGTRWKLAATPGGTAINFSSLAEWLYIEIPPYPLEKEGVYYVNYLSCLLYTSPSPRDS